jgi:hypothetical protein
MRRLIAYVQRLIEQGIADGELDAVPDPAAEAELIVATLEGALMLSKLYDDSRYVRQAATRVARQAAALARPAAG